MAAKKAVDPRGRVASLAKAASIIEAFTVHRPELTAAELSAATSMDRTTIHRFLRTLVSLGQLEQSASSKKYRLGLKVLDPAYALLDAMEIRSVAASHLVDFHYRTHRWVAVGVPHGREMIIVERMWGGGEISSVFQLGHKLPMARSSLGRSVLAGYSPSRRRALLTEIKELEDDRLDVDAVMADLVTVAERNLALVEGGLWANLRSIGSAFRDHTGDPVGAITTWNDMGQPIEPALQSELTDIASRISYSLGFRGQAAASSERSFDLN